MRRRLLFALGLLLAPVGVAVGMPGPIVRAQAPYRPELVGIPGPEMVIDVRWSGDRHGEFIQTGVLPPAFRGPGPAQNISGFIPAGSSYAAPPSFYPGGAPAAPLPLPSAPGVAPAPLLSTPAPVPNPVLFPPPTVLGPLPR
jgi:hypothetical protein